MLLKSLFNLVFAGLAGVTYPNLSSAVRCSNVNSTIPKEGLAADTKSIVVYDVILML